MPAAKAIDREHLTPFAAKLLDFMWEQRPSWNRSDLWRATNISRNTIDSWFISTRDPKRQPSLPTGEAVRAIQDVTHWTDDEMKALTGYAELPPRGLRDYLLQELRTWPMFDAFQRTLVREFLAEASAEHERLVSQRPPRRRRAPVVRQQPKQTASTTADTEPAAEHQDDHQRPTKRTPVSSGK